MKHISAEQKRRFNIKMGFDTLNSLISNNSKPVSCLRVLGGGNRMALPCVPLVHQVLLPESPAFCRPATPSHCRRPWSTSPNCSKSGARCRRRPGGCGTRLRSSTPPSCEARAGRSASRIHVTGAVGPFVVFVADGASPTAFSLLSSAHRPVLVPGGGPAAGQPCPPGAQGPHLLPAAFRASPDSFCCFSSCQQLLPATGVSVTRLQFDHMRDMFDEYVKSRILQNWKFWIVSLGYFFALPSCRQ